MWRHRYEERTELGCERLWPILTDVAGWPGLDRNIEYLEIEGPPDPGAPFVLKVRGGPKLAFVIDEFPPPMRCANVRRMALAAMRTRRTLIADGGGATIRVDIGITGLLAPIWDRLVGRKHAAGLPARTARFVEAARRRLAHA